MARTTHFTEQHLTKLTKHQADQDADEAAAIVEDRSQKPPLAQRRFFDSNDNLATANGCTTAAAAGTPRPDKPPRPVLVSTECQTLNRSQYRSAKETDRANKPAVQPKSMLFVNRSTENLSDKRCDDDEHFYDEVAVTFREKADSDGGGGGCGEKPAKPAIPERPISLMRPPSYKTQANDTTNYQPSSLQQLHTQHDQQPLKKTQSFRSNATTTSAQTPTKMNGAGNGSLTTLERTHIYNVDKKQVAIIDFVDQTSAASASSSSNREKRPTLDDITTETAATMTMSTVPPSPRGFDSKIKRPGVPAPPPPTNRPKSDGGDSTNL